MPARSPLTPLCLALAAAACGCAGPGLSFGRSAKAVKTHPDAGEIELTAGEDRGRVVQADYRREDDGPFRDARPIDGGNGPFRDPDVTPVAAAEDGPPEAVSRRLDPATLRLVDSELEDATPEERVEFYETIRDVEPQLIPHMLRLRRTMAERAKLRAAETEDRLVREAERRGRSVERTDAEPVRTADAAMDIRPRRDELIATDDRAADFPSRERPAERPPAEQAPVEPVAAAPDPPAATWPPNDVPADPPPKTPVAATPASASRSIFEEPDPAPLSDESGRYTLANDYDEQLARLIDLMEQDLAKRAEPATDAERDEAARLHVFLRMLYLMDGQQARTMQAVPHLPEPHQEFWTQLFWGLANYFDSQNLPDAGARATEAVTQLREAADRLQPEARLLLRNATFCHKIDGFGKYARFDRDEFTPGQRVLVYLEARNFHSELGEAGEYTTRLRTTVEFHRSGRGPTAGLVETTDFPTTEDTCRSVRRDYFNAYDIYLPDDLRPGPHVLKLIVEDELSHRVATASLNFTVR